MSIIQSASNFVKNIGSGIMSYFRLTPRLAKLIGLEIFVFGTFIAICFVISEGIMRIPDSPKPGLNFLFASLKVGISLLLIGLWLGVWYYLTKRLMKNDRQENKEKEENE
ncbi:MAG: hypothetical protein KAU62_08770 [Candidatus Heimdallarchaeota archaeon]|nr:hypothetical protein [Candidatus Heimdallarchaeota archaeon]MCG3256162.1 hypothetical protein [Candidatus Heimdallarchaeota archaeon]MCK4611232.1 hypothetical protein [Candidatus Heimdallarchaeota archaeon]